MLKYRFTVKRRPLLTFWTARRILNAYNKGLESTTVTLDLGFTWEKVRIVSRRYVDIRGVLIDISQLENVRDDSIYLIRDDGIVKITLYTNGKYYKLKALGETVSPTLEINGIHMHRIKDVTPIEDAELKVKVAKVSKCHRVLDVCTGLGYTAIKSLERGACEVVTVEKDLNVLKIAELNPWSWRLSDSRISLYLADAVEFVKRLPSEYFDRVIHDPPRFSLAGELYSEEFYSQLYRVLKRGGILYHYIGEPGRVRGKSIVQGVISRLKRVGFYVRKNHYTLSLGITAYKD